MATLFSLNDGNLTDSTVFGQTLSSADFFDGTTNVSVSTSYGLSSIKISSIISDGSSISAVAVNVDYRATNPVGTLSMFLSSPSSSTTETYAISSFTSYDARNNLISFSSQNWQILKLSSPFNTTLNQNILLDFKTSNSNQLSLVASSTKINKALITTTTKDPSNIIDYGTLIKNNITLSAASPFGDGTDSSISFAGNTNSYVSLTSNDDTTLTGDFTIELWANFASIGAASQALMQGTWNGNNQLAIWHHASWPNKITVWSWGGYSSSIPFLISSTSLTTNRWYHIAASRSGNVFRLFIDGNLEATYSNAITINQPFVYIGRYIDGGGNVALPFNGCMSNIRFIKGFALYTESFTKPSAPLTPIPSTSLLYRSAYGTNYERGPDVYLHIGGALKGLTSESRTLTASTAYFNDLYIHNQGKLKFPTDSSKTLYSTGSKGLQITSDGTLEIGTVVNPISSAIQHNIIINNTQIDIHNGGNMNVYGAYKKPYAYLTADSLSATKSFTVVDSVSTSWLSGDSVVFTPNTYQRTSFDVLTLSSFDSGTTFKTTTSAIYNHPSVTSLGNVPTVSNLSRNVSIKGISSSSRATVRAVDAAKVNIVNTQFTNFGIASDNKRGFVVGTNSSGYVSLSGNSFYSDGYAGTTHIATASGRTTLGNLSLKDNVFFKSGGYGVSLSSVSATGLTVTGNTVLSANNSGLYFASVSSSGATMANNTVIGSKSYGTFITNCTIDGDFGGAINYGNANRGLVLSADHIGNLNNLISMYNTNEGIYIDGAMAGLSSTIFSGITSNNNTSTGIQVSGNNVNASSPIVLNMSNVVAKNNDGIGFEMYNISGNISSVYLDNNLNYGMKTSLGGETTIDGLSSFLVAGPSTSTLTKTGTLTLSTASPFGVGTDSSIYFANPNYITVPSNDLNSDSNDFTIECWFRLTASGSYYTIFSFGDYRHDNGLLCRVDTVGDGGIYNNTNNYGSWGAVPKNQWHHLAVCRVSGSLKVYLNGTLRLTTTINSSSTLRDLYIGTSPHTGLGNEGLQGYISNFRIVKRNAVYTKNFTPQSSPLSLIGNTAFLYKAPYGTSYDLIAYRGSSAINLGLIGGSSYYPINIKNSNISSESGLYYGTPLVLDSTNYKQFNVENTTLSSNSDAVTLQASTDKVRGSYMFNKCFVGSSPVLGGDNYQDDVFKTTGVAFMNKNNVEGNNSTHFAAGERSLDSTIYINPASSPSERLTPRSTTIKLRSGSKFVALNSGESVTLIAYVRKSTLVTNGIAYNGNSPRLMLKRNSAMGITQDIVMDQLDTTSESFLKLSAQSPAVTYNGVLEFYVDCDGTQGFINIDNWAAI